MNENAGGVISGLSLLLISGSLLAWALIIRALWQRQPIIPLSRRLSVPWTGLDMLVLAISYIFCETLGAQLAHSATDSHESVIPAILVTSSLAHIGWFLFAVVFLISRGAYLDDLGWQTSHTRSDLRNGFWLFLAASVPILMVQLFFTEYLQIPSKHPLLELTKEQPNWKILTLATIAAVGVAPWFEEFVFRVVLQGWLEAEQVRLRRLRDPDSSDKPGFAPLLIASFLFAALHAGAGPDPVAIFILSLFLGYAYRQTHRILPSFVIHTCVNGWTMLNVWIMYLAPTTA